MKVAFIVCGTVAASHFPLHASWIQHNHPGVVQSVVLTKSAQRFVSAQTLKSILQCPVLEDDWDSFLDSGTNHVKFGEENDVLVVYPASVDYVRRLSGLDFASPTTAALACGTARVVVFPSLPPGIKEHPESQRQRKKLSQFPRFSLYDPVEGQSLSSTRSAFTPPAIWDVWDAIVSTKEDR